MDNDFFERFYAHFPFLRKTPQGYHSAKIIIYETLKKCKVYCIFSSPHFFFLCILTVFKNNFRQKNFPLAFIGNTWYNVYKNKGRRNILRLQRNGLKILRDIRKFIMKKGPNMTNNKNALQTRAKNETDRTQIKTWLPTVIALVFFALLMSVLPHRAAVIICLFLSLATIVVGIILSLGNKKTFYYAFGFILLAFLIPVIPLVFRLQYTFVNGMPTALLTVPAIVGLAVSILFTFAFRIHNEKLRPIGTFIGMTLLFAFLFAFGFCMIGTHLNYVLDTTPPTPCEAVIEDKEIERHRKSLDTYEFLVTVDEKQITLDVSSDEYHRYDIGDTYAFYRRQGAFDMPFYFEE